MSGSFSKLPQDLAARTDHKGNRIPKFKRWNLRSRHPTQYMTEEDQGDKQLEERLARVKKVLGESPERRVFFSRDLGKVDDSTTIDMKTRFIYPMEGGTALVTFEETAVATRILAMQKHQVSLSDNCRITVGVQPVHLVMPSFVKIEMERLRRTMYVSGLPSMDVAVLQNELERHFSRVKSGGGPVESCEIFPVSGTALLTFVEKEGLIEKQYHDVELQQKTHRVTVTWYNTGKVATIRVKMTPCLRTLQLTGIPNVLEQEVLQDLLEIHFQKSINGGGEIEAFLYNPVGQKVSAVFENVS